MTRKKMRALKRGVRTRIRWKRWVFGMPIALLMPFLLLVRLSTWLYLVKEWNGWMSVGIAALVAGLLLGGLVVGIGHRIGLRLRLRTVQFSGLIVAVYCIYLLVFISASQVKSPDIANTYTDLHPVLRVALSTIMVVNQELIVTDTGRTSEDYVRMGLSENNSSFHFTQEDGFVHAVDLRTKDRPEIQNRLTKAYFSVMGFNTLRHVGTADHLHVSLPMR